MFDNAEGMVFRPPSEANSFILRATIGCSHNRCTFCSMYRDVQFRARPISELETIIRNTARRYPELRRVFLADGNALALELRQPVDGRATVKHPHRLIEHAPQREQFGIRRLAIRVVVRCGRNRAALDKADLRFACLQTLQILQRAFRRQYFQGDAITRQQGGVAFGEMVIGAAFAATGHDHMARRCGFDELIGNDETHAGNQEDPPRRREKITQR